MAIQIWVSFYIISCSGFERKKKKITLLLENFRNADFFLGGSFVWLLNTYTDFEYRIN